MCVCAYIPCVWVGGFRLGAMKLSVIDDYIREHNKTTKQYAQAKENFIRSCAGGFGSAFVCMRACICVEVCVVLLLCCVVFWCVVLCCGVLCCVVLCCVVLCCVVLCCVVLCCVVLYCAVLVM